MELATKSFVLQYKALFEEVMKDYSNVKHEYDSEYSILNYEKILSEMIDFMKGYIEYEEDGERKFSGKVLSRTKLFYDNMFMDKKYRMTITLSDFKDVTKTFLEKTKELQTFLEEHSCDKGRSELCAMCLMTDKQYKKLGKVYKDDMKLYLWLSASNSKVFGHDVDAKLRQYFEDESTPVMHRVKH